MSDDIVSRMRRHASLSGLHTFEGTKEERKSEFHRMRRVANDPRAEIVDRLRAMAWLANCSENTDSHLVQAANQIERLRAQLREYTGDGHTIGRDANVE